MARQKPRLVMSPTTSTTSRGYFNEHVLKIAGRNHLRAMRRMAQVAADLQRTESLLISERAKAS